jgi:hypothetical protein
MPLQSCDLDYHKQADAEMRVLADADANYVNMYILAGHYGCPAKSLLLNGQWHRPSPSLVQRKLR